MSIRQIQQFSQGISPLLLFWHIPNDDTISVFMFLRKYASCFFFEFFNSSIKMSMKLCILKKLNDSYDTLFLSIKTFSFVILHQIFPFDFFAYWISSYNYYCNVHTDTLFHNYDIRFINNRKHNVVFLLLQSTKREIPMEERNSKCISLFIAIKFFVAYMHYKHDRIKL